MLVATPAQAQSTPPLVSACSGVQLPRSMVAMGVGVYQGQQAVAFGFSTRLNGARTVIRAGASFDTRGRAAGNAGVGIQF